jgi:hypothetical protein
MIDRYELGPREPWTLPRVLMLILGLALMLLSPTIAAAQTRVTTFAWDYDDTPAAVATYTQAVRVNDVAIVIPPTCVAKTVTPAVTTCSVPITANTGSNTVSVAATKDGVTKTTIYSGIDLSRGPKEPSAPRINITVSITLPGPTN